MTASSRSCALLALIVAVSTICTLWYASAELNNKNWDEGHSLRNVRSILTTGNWRPTFPFYPALSHLPQAALLRVSQRLYQATGNEVFAALTPNGNFTATTYRVTRATSTLYGIGVLLMVYAIGRRIFSEKVGLLATAILAISPYFLKSSGIYKPDALLMLTALVAFHFAVRAAEDGSARYYLLAGVAVGVSAAGKQNGAFAAIPLTAATLLGFRETKRWLWLACAGAISIAVFLLFNPWLDLLPSYLHMAERYTAWAQESGQTHVPHLLVYAAGLPFAWSWHGFALGAVAWIGLIGLTVRAFKDRHRWPQSAGMALLVTFVFAYPLVCATVSSYPKPNIFIATLPFTALAAAWTLATASRWVLAHTSKRLGFSLLGLASAALLASAAAPYATYLYSVAVPKTDQIARQWIERNAGFLGQRTIVSEGPALGVGHRPWNHRPVVPLERSSRRLSDLTSSELALADYEVFPQAALDREDREFYEERIASPGNGRVAIFEPLALRRRGPGLVVLAHPWRLQHPGTAEPEAQRVNWSRQGKRRLQGNLPRGFHRGHVVSLDLTLTPEQAAECELVVDAAATPIYPYQRSGARALYMTRRFVATRRSTPVRFHCPRRDLFEPEPLVEALRWAPRRPAATAD